MKTSSPSTARATGLRRRARRRPATIEDVRRVLLEPDRERIVRLESRPCVEEKSVGDVLPEAVAHASKERLSELSIALEPSMTKTFRTVVEREHEMFGEILAPSIGAAVKRAIADVILAMQQRFDEALARSFSLESVRWRIEARRTGRPFAEVVLMHSLVYRVEQVFLIHSPSGILLQHVADPSTGAPVADQVASMLSAIDAFARDTFRSLPPGTHLSKVQVGDRTIWVEHDGVLTIAAIVQGVAPSVLANALRDARERIRVAYAEELESYRYDVSRFAETRPDLERLLRTEQREPPRRARLVLAVVTLVLLVVFGGAITSYASGRADVEAQRQAYHRAFGAEPGIVVSEVEHRDDGFVIRGFRDPLARSPEEIFRRHGLAPAEVRLESFLSLDERLGERRAVQILRPPSDVRLALSDDGTLRATGTAPRAWIERTRLLAPSLFGVERYVDDDLRARESDALHRAAAELERYEVRFTPESAEPVGLERAITSARRLLALAPDAGASACIEAIGYTDAIGTVRSNNALSEARARSVVRELSAGGIPADRLRSRGAGTRVGVSSDVARAVAFQVELREAGSDCRAS